MDHHHLWFGHILPLLPARGYIAWLAYYTYYWGAFCTGELLQWFNR